MGLLAYATVLPTEYNTKLMLRKFLVSLTIATTTLVQSPVMAEMATYYSDYYQGRRTASCEK